MNSVQRRTVPILAVALGFVLATACGGGGSSSSGGGGTINPGLTATYTPTTTTPGPGTIGIADDTASGADFDVEVQITGPLNDFFGAAFHVLLPANVSLIAPADCSGSVIAGGASLQCTATQVNNELFVTVTRFQSGGYISGVDLGAGTSKLVGLSLRGNTATSGSVDFLPVAARAIETCDDGTQQCTTATGAGTSLTWSGGTLTVQ